MNNVTRLPPGAGLGPPPDYFNPDQVKAWEDFVRILPPESRDPLFRWAIEVCAIAVWNARRKGFMESDMQANFRGWLYDLGLDERAVEALGLPPFGNVHPIE